MSAAAVPRIPATRRLQPGHREERRKNLGVFVARKMATRKPSASDQCPEIRSPLMERSNRDFQKKAEQVKRNERRMVKPADAENIRPAVSKDGKTLKEKPTKDEKVKLESTKGEPKPPTKPVLGAYRGKIVQSKINSFRKNSENQNLPENKTQAERPQSSASVPARTLVRPSGNDVKPKRPVIPPVSLQTRPPSTLTKSKSEPVTVRRTTLYQQRPIQQKAQPIKPPLRNGAVKNNPVMTREKKSSAPVKTLPGPQQSKPAPPLPTASKFIRPRETAEERRARLAEWKQSKGKVMKRPPGTVSVLSTCNVPKEMPEIKPEPEEEPKEEPRQLYWATMAEEDEQELFTLKIHQTFGGCKRLIDEGCSREEVLSILEKQIQTVPEARKLSGYWECLAHLEKRDGQLYKVIAVCEEAVAAGAQPLEQLRAILADALEQLKPDPEESVKKENEEDLKSEETEVKEETVETTVKGKSGRGKDRAAKLEPKSPSTPDRPPKSECTPQNGDAASSVIKFEIRSTPHLEKMKKLQLNDGESGIKSYKFLTPVRRSSRLEHKSHRLPDMLKDHDPCISGIDQLGDLEDTDACSSAYIFRKNSALKDVTAKSATRK